MKSEKSCPIINNIKKLFTWFSSLNCFERLNVIAIGIITVFLLRFIILFLFFDEKYYGYADVAINTLGAIAIPCVIYWLSDYRNAYVKEKQHQIEVLNCIYADLFELSKNLISSTKSIQLQLIHATNSIEYIDTHVTNFNNDEFTEIEKYVLFYPSSDYILKYSDIDYLFLSIDDSMIYYKLLSFEKFISKTSIYIDSFRDDLTVNNRIRIEKQKSSSIQESIKNERLFLIGICSSLDYLVSSHRDLLNDLENIIKILNIYVDANYSHQIVLRSKSDEFLTNITAFFEKNEK